MQKGFISNHVWVLTSITTQGCLKMNTVIRKNTSKTLFFLSLYSETVEGGERGKKKAWEQKG